MSNGKEFSLAVVEPAITPSEARVAIEKFAAIEKALLDEEDFQEFTSKGAKHRFPKKSAFRKLALAFNLSDEILEERTEDIGDPPIRVWHFTVKAIAPNGRYSIGVGSFSTDEREVAHEIHDPRAMAHTRAKNRAISDLIAGGMLSAEEMVGSKEYKASPPKATTAPAQPRVPAKTKLTEPAVSPEMAELKSLRQQLHLKWEELQKADPNVGDKKEWLKENYRAESSTELSLEDIREAVQKVNTMLQERGEPPASQEQISAVTNVAMGLYEEETEKAKKDKVRSLCIETTGKQDWRTWTKLDLDKIRAKVDELKSKPADEQALDFLKEG